MVWRWQQRFAEEGLDGLLRDKTRLPGKPATPQSKVQAVLEQTLTGEPPGVTTHWTGRASTGPASEMTIRLSSSRPWRSADRDRDAGCEQSPRSKLGLGDWRERRARGGRRNAQGAPGARDREPGSVARGVLRITDLAILPPIALLLVGVPIAEVVADRLVDVERLQGGMADLVLVAKVRTWATKPSRIQVAFLFYQGWQGEPEAPHVSTEDQKRFRSAAGSATIALPT